jgi:hypothetical protein
MRVGGSLVMGYCLLAGWHSWPGTQTGDGMSRRCKSDQLVVAGEAAGCWAVQTSGGKCHNRYAPQEGACLAEGVNLQEPVALVITSTHVELHQLDIQAELRSVPAHARAVLLHPA